MIVRIASISVVSAIAAGALLSSAAPAKKGPSAYQVCVGCEESASISCGSTITSTLVNCNACRYDTRVTLSNCFNGECLLGPDGLCRQDAPCAFDLDWEYRSGCTVIPSVRTVAGCPVPFASTLPASLPATLPSTAWFDVAPPETFVLACGSDCDYLFRIRSADPSCTTAFASVGFTLACSECVGP